MNNTDITPDALSTDRRVPPPLTAMERWAVAVLDLDLEDALAWDWYDNRVEVLDLPGLSPYHASLLLEGLAPYTVASFTPDDAPRGLQSLLLIGDAHTAPGTYVGVRREAGHVLWAEELPEIAGTRIWAVSDDENDRKCILEELARAAACR